MRINNANSRYNSRVIVTLIGTLSYLLAGCQFAVFSIRWLYHKCLIFQGSNAIILIRPEAVIYFKLDARVPGSNKKIVRLE